MFTKPSSQSYFGIFTGTPIRIVKFFIFHIHRVFYQGLACFLLVSYLQVYFDVWWNNDINRLIISLPDSIDCIWSADQIFCIVFFISISQRHFFFISRTSFVFCIYHSLAKLSYTHLYNLLFIIFLLPKHISINIYLALK